ncbi:MAG TPA: SPW repeat protein [Gammaproteobacteria bacterium]
MDKLMIKRLDLVVILSAGWLILAPFLLGYYLELPGVTLNAILVGSVIGVFAIMDFELPKWWEEGINCLLGVWLIFSPLVFAFENNDTAVWNMIVPGVIVIAATASEYIESHGRGRAKLRRRGSRKTGHHVT